MTSRTIAMLLAFAALSACKSTSVPEMAAGFDVARDDVGEQARVCGYKKGATLYESKDGGGGSFFLADYNLLDEGTDGYRCVLGQVVWLGCASERSGSCGEAVSDFGLKVTVRTY